MTCPDCENSCRPMCLACERKSEALATDVDRALLERDVREVEHAIAYSDWSENGLLTVWERHDCAAWLTRARAALA